MVISLMKDAMVCYTNLWGCVNISVLGCTGTSLMHRGECHGRRKSEVEFGDWRYKYRKGRSASLINIG